MTEQALDGANVVACFEQMSGEAMPQGMGGDWFGEAAVSYHLAQYALDGAGGDGATGDETGKQVRPLGMHALEVRSQHLEQPLAQHYVAVLGPFALADVDEHPAAVDVVDLQGASLRNTQSGAVSRHQDGTVLDGLGGLEKSFHLFPGEDVRQFL